MMPRAARIARFIALSILIVAIVTATGLLLFTPNGHYIRSHPHEAGQHFQRWVEGHRTIAPLTYVALFIAMAVLMLPVWWLQILGGYGFGLVIGVFWSEIGATLGGVTAMLISRWIAGDWFHNKVERRLVKLRRLDEKLGHNGLLVVVAVRLMHFMPVGLSNYVFGITRISVIDIVIGTLLGGLPVVTWWVAIGSGLRPWDNWQLLVFLGALHVVLLVPIVLRYLKPQWFKRYGIE